MSIQGSAETGWSGDDDGETSLKSKILGKQIHLNLSHLKSFGPFCPRN